MSTNLQQDTWSVLEKNFPVPWDKVRVDGRVLEFALIYGIYLHLLSKNPRMSRYKFRFISPINPKPRVLETMFLGGRTGVHHKHLVTWENRAPKDWQVASPLVMVSGFSYFFGLFQVIMANPEDKYIVPAPICWETVLKNSSFYRVGPVTAPRGPSYRAEIFLPGTLNNHFF